MMNGKKLIFATIAMLITMLVIAQVKASPGPTIAFNPTSVKDLEPNASFTIDATIAEADNVYGWQVNLTFTPGVLSVTKVTEGSFLKNANLTAWPLPSIRNDLGYVLFSCLLWSPGYPPQGASGSGTLATIELKVESGGSTSLQLGKGTYLRTIIGGSLVPIEGLSLQDGSFTGTGGGLQIPLEIIAGAIAAVVVVVVVVVLYLKRRK
jgi:hypothetical protein